MRDAVTWNNLPKSKGKRPCSSNCQGTFLLRPRRAVSIIRSLSFLRNNTPSKMSRWSQYSIYSRKGNKLKLPEARRPNEVGHTNDPSYYLFHRMFHHPTNKCFVLKDKIQALVNVGVLTLKSEQKKVTTNMVTLEFGKTPKVIVPDGSFPILKHG